MTDSQKIFIGILVFLSILLPILIQIKERQDRHGCLGYMPILSLLFSIPLITIALITFIVGKYKLWVKGSLGKVLVMNLVAYPVVFVLVELFVYDFDVSEAFSGILTEGMQSLWLTHLVVITLVTLLFRWILSAMEEAGEAAPQAAPEQPEQPPPVHLAPTSPWDEIE